MRFNEFRSVEADFLEESKGIFGREAGDKFVHLDGREWELVEVLSFPQPDDNNGQFVDVAARDEAIKAFEEQNKNTIEWVNSPANNLLAFGVAVLDDLDGNHVLWGKYVQRILPTQMRNWKNAEIPQGWALATKSSMKMQAGYDPQNLIKVETVFDSVESIIATVEKNSPDAVRNVFAEALKDLAQGRMNEVRFPGMMDQQPAIRDYFGEIMQPIALMGGNIKGQAEDARQALADGYNWRDCGVRWPMAGNEPLCDSYIVVPTGQEIGISSKGGAGAAASAKNLADAVDAARKKNPDIIAPGGIAEYTAKIVEKIREVDQRNGPIEVGKMLKVELIDDKLNEEISKYIAEGKSDLENISPQAFEVVKRGTAKGLVPDAKGFNAGFALLSAASKYVAKVINENPQFSKGAIALLNMSDIVQIFTDVGKQKDDVIVRGFRAVYPPSFTGKVILEGGKNYYSTRIGGKMSFKIK